LYGTTFDAAPEDAIAGGTANSQPVGG